MGGVGGAGATLGMVPGGPGPMRVAGSGDWSDVQDEVTRMLSAWSGRRTAGSWHGRLEVLVARADEPQRTVCRPNLVGSDDPPTALVDLAVVESAEQESVGEIRGAPLCPWHDVMGVGVHGRSSAPGEPAPSVARGKGLSLRSGEGADLSAQVEGDASRVEHQPSN